MHRLADISLTLYALLTEWESMEKHTEGFMKSDRYKPFLDDFTAITTQEKPLVFLHHFACSPSPAHILSSKYKTFELFLVTLKDPSDIDGIKHALQPLHDAWTKEGRSWTLSPCLDKGVNKYLWVVPYESIGEHKAAGSQEKDNAAIEANKIWQSVDLQAHITP